MFQEGHHRFEVDRGYAPFIVDCGANIGVATLYWKSPYPGARILAFEPDPLIASDLRGNVAAAGASNVAIVAAAVWTENTTLPFCQPGAGVGRLGSGPLCVRTVRLRDVLAGRHRDLLKSDIEGAEVDVLRDCRGALERVDRLFVEYHSFATQRQRINLVVETLVDADYRLFVRTEFCPTAPFADTDLRDDMDMQLNMYATRYR